MIPLPGKALSTLAAKLASRVAPEIPSTYGATNVGLISMLLPALAREADRGIEDRLEDGRELAALFQTTGDAPGHDARQQFATSLPASYTHADVSAWLDDGLGLLIELHTWAEQEDPALNQRIWDFLYRHTERYKLDP